jgi:single-strand DNA-binding protein
MVNRVILIGNLGRDPEVRTLESGAKVAKFSIATNENYRDKSGEWQSLTEWHDIVLWRSQAERAERDLKKGASIYLEGKLTHRKWQDQDGNNRKTTEVVGSYFRIINRPGTSTTGTNTGYFPSENDEIPTNSGDYASTNKVAENESMSTTASEEPANNENADDDLPF